MKVIHIASGDLWAGAEVQLYHLLSKLVKRDDMDLLVVLLNHGQLEIQLKDRDVNVVVLDEAILSSFAIFSTFRTIVKEFQPDLIHTHRTKENIIGGLTAWLENTGSIRTVHGASEFSGDGFNLKRNIIGYLDKVSASWFQKKIIAVSSDLKQKLKERFPEKKLVVIENGLDIEYVENRSLDRSVAQVEDDNFNIAFVGRFVSVKRVELFYEIAKNFIILNPGSNVQFHMFGDGPHFKIISDKIEEDKNNARVHLYGFVENLAPELKRMQLLIFTSTHEGLPMTLLEAMCLRIPVLSHELPSLREVLCNGNCGFFVETDNSEQFVRAIQEIMLDKKTITKKVDYARMRLERSYSINVTAEKYWNLYCELV